MQQREITAGRAWLMAALLVLATVLAYQPVWHAGFIWDDDAFLTDSALIKAADGLYRFWFTSASHDYVPATSTTLWLEWRLWGNNPLGYHLVNVLLHAASSVLLWRVMARLKIRGAGLAAAIFALHPVNVESVAWITERKNVLCMVFYLLSLLLYLRSEALPDAKMEDGGWRMEDGRWKMAKGRLPFSILHPPSSLLYWLSVLAFILALLSKPAVAPLPLVLLGLAWWRRGRVNGRDIRRCASFFIAAAASAAIAAWIQYYRNPGALVRADSLWSRLAGAGWAVWFYLYKALWPLNLTFVYPRWSIDASKALSYVPGLLAAAVLVVCWHYRRRWGRPVLVALGYFIVMLLPVLGFLNIYFMRYSLVADHWQYFAILGPIALVAAALTAAGEGRARSPLRAVASPARRGLRALPCGALLLALGVLTWKQAHIYADQETLWQDTLARNPACSMAHHNLGIAFARKGQIDEAIRQFQEAIRLKPDDALAYNNLGIALAGRGQIEEAIRQFEEAIRLKPDNAEPHNHLGDVLGMEGRLDEAISQYQETLRLKPEQADARNNLGIALARIGQSEEALSQFQEAVHLKPDFAEARNNLGIALARVGQIAEAISQFQEAIRLKPGYTEARCQLGNALLKNGRMDEAISQFQEALRLKPDAFQAHLALALILPRAGRLKDAASHLEEFLRTCPPASLEAPSSPVRNQAVGALNDLAWFLATGAQAQERDGPRAVRFAERACELTGYQLTVMVSTLAAAYAEAGRFPEAVATAQKAITLATQAGDQARLARNRQLLELYQAGRPYHEAAAAQQPAVPQP